MAPQFGLSDGGERWFLRTAQPGHLAVVLVSEAGVACYLSECAWAHSPQPGRVPSAGEPLLRTARAAPPAPPVLDGAPGSAVSPLFPNQCRRALEASQKGHLKKASLTLGSLRSVSFLVASSLWWEHVKPGGDMGAGRVLQHARHLLAVGAPALSSPCTHRPTVLELFESFRHQ